MATFEEIGADWATQIRTAAESDSGAGRSTVSENLGKTAAAKSLMVKQASLTSALARFEARLAQLTINNQPLSEDQKFRIVTITAKRLGLQDPRKFQLIMKEASNDRFVGLVSHWDDFFRELGIP